LVAYASVQDDGKGFAASVFTLGDDSEEDEAEEEDADDAGDKKDQSTNKGGKPVSTESKTDDRKSASATNAKASVTPTSNSKAAPSSSPSNGASAGSKAKSPASAAKDGGKPSKSPNNAADSTAETKPKVSMFAALGQSCECTGIGAYCAALVYS